LIIKQYEPGNFLYFIMDGYCKVTVESEAALHLKAHKLSRDEFRRASTFQKVKLYEGQYFGEIACFTKMKTTASVAACKSSTSVVVATLPKQVCVDLIVE
jgi:CRP-like cAMP-binding protein